nr:pollen-specific leucine-rich repeat extensin-like protein 2 [Penaeus vannamei]
MHLPGPAPPTALPPPPTRPATPYSAAPPPPNSRSYPVMPLSRRPPPPPGYGIPPLSIHAGSVEPQPTGRNHNITTNPTQETRTECQRRRPGWQQQFSYTERTTPRVPWRLGSEEEEKKKDSNVNENRSPSASPHNHPQPHTRLTTSTQRISSAQRGLPAAGDLRHLTTGLIRTVRHLPAKEDKKAVNLSNVQIYEV